MCVEGFVRGRIGSVGKTRDCQNRRAAPRRVEDNFIQQLLEGEKSAGGMDVVAMLAWRG
jgi:hypothetical protein